MNRTGYAKHETDLRVAVAPQGRSSLKLYRTVPLRGDRYTGIARRGFATITALALLSFVATALATLTLTFAADARRTARESTDAQLRQLIIAGAAQVRQFTERDEPQTGPKAIPLPPSLIADGGELILHFNPANKKVVARIGAKFRYVRASIDVEQ